MAVAGLVAGCGSSGKIAGYLPKASPQEDRVVTASAGHPQLATQGVPVEVHLRGEQVLADVAGPKVPPFTLPVPPAVACTFSVTLSNVRGRAPVSLDDFTVRTASGRLLRLTYPAGHAPPAAVTTGGAVSFELTQVLPTGEGRLYWAPQGGPDALVAWDFVVEND